MSDVCADCRHPLRRHHERVGCNDRIPTRSGDSVPCYCLVKAVKACESPNCCHETSDARSTT